MATINLTPDQKSQVQKVVGHKLDEVTKDLGQVGNVTLTLTDDQKKIIERETGKRLSVIELTEQDLKVCSSTACYERGGVVVT